MFLRSLATSQKIDEQMINQGSNSDRSSYSHSFSSKDSQTEDKSFDLSLREQSEEEEKEETKNPALQRKQLKVKFQERKSIHESITEKVGSSIIGQIKKW